MNLFEAFLIYSVIVEGKDMTVMDNQHESGKIIPKKGIVNTRWIWGNLTENNWVYIFEGIREYRVKRGNQGHGEGLELEARVWEDKYDGVVKQM